MNDQITGSNATAMTTHQAIETFKTDLAWGVNAIRRLFLGTALVVLTVIIIKPAEAALTGDDLAAAMHYIATHSGMREDQKQLILTSDNLEQANDRIRGNTYWDTNTNIPLPPITHTIDAYRLTVAEPGKTVISARPLNQEPSLVIPSVSVPMAILTPAKTASVPMTTMTQAKTASVSMSTLTPAKTASVPMTTMTQAKTASVPMSTLTQAKMALVPMTTMTQAKTASVPMSTLTPAKTASVPTSTLTPAKTASVPMSALRPLVSQQVRSASYDQQIIALNAQAEQNHAEVLSESHSRASGDAQTLQQSQDYTNHKFADLKSQVDDNKKQAAAGSASAMAQANIPQVQESQQFAVGAGIGGYDSENALSVGASFHAGSATIVKMSVSNDTQSNVGYGAGVSVGW